MGIKGTQTVHPNMECVLLPQCVLMASKRWVPEATSHLAPFSCPHSIWAYTDDNRDLIEQISQLHIWAQKGACPFWVYTDDIIDHHIWA